MPDRANNDFPVPWVYTLERGFIYMNLYEIITSWPNLIKAYKKACKGKRSLWYVADFEIRLEENLLRLQDELIHRTYRPVRYHSFYIHDPKKRLISAAPFRDRVVHHALCNVIEPIFERSFIYDSYANRIGKGTHRALNRCQMLARRFKYLLFCDVRQYFPSVDHEILRSIIARKISDPETLCLIDRILESGKDILKDNYDMVYFPGDDLFAVNRSRGLPIGNLTSQFWANVYLNSFDHFVKRQLRCKGYVRYVDDMVLFDNDIKRLWQWKKAIVDKLTELRLTIHPETRPKPVEEGITFLGFVVFPQRKRLKRVKGIRFQRKFKLMCRQWVKGHIPMSTMTASVMGWVNHARYGNTVGLRKAILCKNIKLHGAS